MNTPINLPSGLTESATREAAERGMSLPEFIRATLERVVSSTPSDDPLFNDSTVFVDDGPDDVAGNHDDYLYGDVS